MLGYRYRIEIKLKERDIKVVSSLGDIREAQPEEF